MFPTRCSVRGLAVEVQTPPAVFGYWVMYGFCALGSVKNDGAKPACDSASSYLMAISAGVHSSRSHCTWMYTVWPGFGSTASAIGTIGEMFDALQAP